MNVLNILFVILFFAAVFAFHVAWSKRRLKQWADQHGFNILSSQYCFVNIGPFSPFGTASGQAIYRISVKDAEGNARSGYARTGGFFFGLLRRRVEVRWDSR